MPAEGPYHVVMVIYARESLPFALDSLRVELAWELGGFCHRDARQVIQAFELEDNGTQHRSFMVTVPAFLGDAGYVDGTLKVLSLEGDCGEFCWTVLGL
jgi:hypothetical protein